jgi:DNA-binding NarL/FixJ family response regulator
MASVCKAIDILIVDGQRIFREGLHSLLKGLATAGNILQAGNALEALQDLRDSACDLVMMGALVPAPNSVACTREIKRLYPRTKVIGLSSYDDDDHVGAMFDNGADAYLLTDTDRVEIELAINSVMGGKHYFSRDLASGVVDRTLRRIDLARQVNTPLNAREMEVLHLLFDELSSKEIACRLFISERTVEFYRQSLIRKTGAKNIVGLIKYAISNGLVKGFSSRPV